MTTALEKKLEEKTSVFNQMVQGYTDFDAKTISMPEIEESLEKTKKSLENLKSGIQSFDQYYMPIIQFNEFNIIDRRLKIAYKIRELANLFKIFNIYYNKNANERLISDIMKVVQIFYKMQKLFNQDLFTQITICQKIKNEVEDQFKGVNKMIHDTINNIDYKNLTPKDIFQLFLISSSPEQFWDFFGFAKSSFLLKRFNMQDLTNFIEDYESVFLFLEKFSKISPLLKQSKSHDYVKSVEDQKAKLENIIEKHIQSQIKINLERGNFYDFFIKSKNKIDQLNRLNKVQFFSNQFKNKLKQMINNYKFLLFNTLKDIEEIDIPEKEEYVRLLIELNNYFHQNLDPAIFKEIPDFNNLFDIFCKNFVSIYSAETSNSVNILSNDAARLSGIITNDKTDVFNSLFTNIVNMQLNSLTYILIINFSKNKDTISKMKSKLKSGEIKIFGFKVKAAKQDDKSLKLPESIDSYEKLDPSELSNFIISIYNNYKCVATNPLFNTYSEFIQKFPKLFPNEYIIIKENRIDD
ncbi:hypothetical protein M9Y10_039114 [Tritrichomonas musculus]|uniref:Uncharacterized protein n=1 Tax=Tritrichomonas musculus TaxID=1915356 RepID=A0ABR2KAG4_9EUKA